MVLSNEGVLLERVRSLREYDGAPTLDPSSFNLKLTDLQAALGICQLGRFSGFSGTARFPRGSLSRSPVLQNRRLSERASRQDARILSICH